MTQLLIALLKGYKKYISPHLGHHCRFVPTCSEYAMQALAVHGFFNGLAVIEVPAVGKIRVRPGAGKRKMGEPQPEPDPLQIASHVFALRGRDLHKK